MQPASAVIGTIEDVAPDVRLFHLLLENGEHIGFEPGAHIDLDVNIAGAWQTRSYSLIGLNPENGLAIAVKHFPAGRGGSAYLWTLPLGARLRLRKPPNTLPPTYEANRYILIAGGIGITPLIGLACSFHRVGRPVTLHYCIRSKKAAPFLTDLTELLGNALVVHESAAGNRLDINSLASNTDADTICYACGPLGLMEELNVAWRGHGLPTRNLRFETFGNSGRLPTGSFTVRVAETGACLQVEHSQSLLDALIAAGQEVMFDCRRGECGLCKVRIEALEGEVDHRDVFLSEQERVDNSAMCCCVSRLANGSITVGINCISHGRSAHSQTVRRPAIREGAA